VISNLLQKSPNDRYANAAELIAALDAAIADEAPVEPVKTAAFPLVPRPQAVEEARVTDPIGRSPSDASISEYPSRKRGSLGLTLLILAAGAGALVYFFGPPEVLGSLLSGVLQASTTPSAAGSTVAASAEASATPTARVESAPAASPASMPADSAGPTPEEPTPASEDTADASPVSSADAAPRPSATHLTPPKPATTKPIHKPPKPPPKHSG
jgi:hypothetical protein